MLLKGAYCVGEHLWTHTAQFPKGGMEQDLTQFAVLIICDDSTARDEMGVFFAT